MVQDETLVLGLRLIGQNDQFQEHKHKIVANISYERMGNGAVGYGGSSGNKTDGRIWMGDMKSGRWGNETRGVNFTYILWKRIK